MNTTRLCLFSVLVLHPSGDSDEGDLGRFQGGLQIGGRVYIVMHEPSLRWWHWHHPVGHFGCRTNEVGGSPKPSQP